MNIIKCTSTANTTACNRTPEWLVIHYTASTKSTTGSATNIAKYFAKPTTKASADFIVDDGQIVQYNPDPTKYYCWAVGGSKYSTLTNSLAAKQYGIAKNANCISIEMCSCKKSTKTMNATDTDWYITDATVNNTVELAKYLMALYNIDHSRVIMHNCVTGKLCPAPWVQNESALSNWYAFKNRLTGTSTTTTTETTSTSKYYRVQLGAYGVKSNAEAQQKKLKDAGFDAIIKQVGNLYKLQLGAYSQKANADAKQKELKAKGFDAVVVYN